ncbi:MAG: peptidylprolyl isomerase [Candidatus Gracilibacteria bacterium]
MKNRHFLQVGAILLTALILGFINLPAEKQQSIFPVTPKAVLDSKYHLGLDLQGGSQLDYKIDLRKVPQKDQKAIIDGVVNVINTRVNGLGVSEPNIYLSNVGEEQHLIVELAGIKDLEEAKKVVGKTIQLEFKELRSQVDPNAAKTVEANAKKFLDKVKKGEDLAVAGKEEELSNPGKVTFDEVDYQFKDQVPGSLTDLLFNKLKTGDVSDVTTASGEFTVDACVALTQSNGFYVVKLVDKRDQEKVVENKRQVSVSHILVAYSGATRADAKITRSQEEAKTLAEDVLKKIQGGAKFEDLAKQYSDDTADKDIGGKLDQPVNGDGKYAKEFETASLGLQKAGDISAVTKTEFGFHIIKANSVREASTEKKIEAQVKYQKVFFDATPDQWQDTGLTGQQFVHADVVFDQLYQPYVSIQFNDEGAKLFETLTARNVNKPIAIFVGGQLISAPNVNEKISGGKAQITGRYTVEEAGNLARDLNTGAIPAPIVLAGQYTIGATLGQDALSKSLWAGLIGFILVALFMIIYYRLLVCWQLCAGGLLNDQCLPHQDRSPLWISIAAGLALFVVLVMKVINSHDSGPEKAIGLLLSAFILFFVTFLLSTPIVMTLAGIAGVILSIGMAVDANILIFERVKEELRDGRTLGSAIEIGFDRALNSIRDSNFSSPLLWHSLLLGSSIIQGFAFNLAAGILSPRSRHDHRNQNTACRTDQDKTCTLWLLSTYSSKALPIIAQRKLTYYISGGLPIGAIIGIPVFDCNWHGLHRWYLMEPVRQARRNRGTDPKAFHDAGDKINQEGVKTSPSVTTQQFEEPKSQQKHQKSDETPALKVKKRTNPTFQQLTYCQRKRLGQENKHISTGAHDQLFRNWKGPRLGGGPASPQLAQPLVKAPLPRSVRAGIASLMIVPISPLPSVKYRVISTGDLAPAIIAMLHDLGIMLDLRLFGVFRCGTTFFITAMLTVLGFQSMTRSWYSTVSVKLNIRSAMNIRGRCKPGGKR